MAHESPKRIRNVALVGHRGSGKTSVNEALLFEAGAINRLGSTADGTTVSDSASDEKAREMSISASLSSFRWDDRKINLLDTPGEPSFLADAIAALAVCEGAVFVVNGVMGVEVTTDRLWQRAEELGLARLVFVNMLDRERADFFRALDSLKEAFGPHVVATEIPIGSEHELQGLIDLVDMKAYRYDGADRGGARDRDPGGAQGAGPGVPREAHGRGGRGVRHAHGAIPRGRGHLPRGDGERAQDRRHRGTHLPRHLRGGHPQPGHQPPSRRLRRGPALTGQEGPVELDGITLEPDEEKDLVAFVFKTLADPFAGRLNLFRVYQGVVTQDSHVHNCRAHVKERVGQLLMPQGKDSEHADEFGPGDIGAVAKLKETRAGDVLAAADAEIPLRMPEMPKPVMAFAIEAKAKGDEEKMGAALRRLQEEDPTIDFHRDQQTGEQIVAGLTQIHVEVIVERMKERFGAEVELHPPRVPYRETIKGKASAHARYKKQTGGRGQFADCHIEIEPLHTGEGFDFVNAIKGGVIPGGFIPAVEKGVQEAMRNGVVAGYPVQRRARPALRRPAPRRGLIGDGVQDRRLHGLQGRHGEGWAAPDGADHEREVPCRRTASGT